MPRRVAILVLLLAVPSVLRADVVEHCVANADVVALARVTSGPAGTPVRVQVIETFKGGHRDELLVEQDESTARRRFTPGTNVFVFAAQADPEAFTVRATHPMIDVAEGFWDSRLHPVRGRDAMTAAARAAAAAYPGPRTAAPPQLTKFGVARGEGELTLRLLRDARTEALVTAEARTPGERWTRSLCCVALVKFDTDSARAVLNELLGNTEVAAAKGEGKWRRGEYRVRLSVARALALNSPEASELLHREPAEWNGVPFSGPAVTYRPVSRTWPLPVLFVGLALAWLVVATVRRSFAFAVRSLLVTACLGAALALLALHVRSRRITDELMLRFGPPHHELASRDGRLVYTLVSDWSPPAADPPPGDWMYSRRLHVGHFHVATTPDHWSPNETRRFARLGFVLADGSIAGPFGARHRYRLFTVPLWVPIVILLLPAAKASGDRFGRRRRRRAGRCAACGYDLRGSGGVCPECGVAKAAAKH